ncbi:hypothetical protein HYALB_00011375 [Hymenoscyphus albidus]|uniref:Uncharacterized protein n=1 Tax=Hymenoscyphus albidus TaxID=595503 RepID=A0A9N9LHE9_9HELO|nr:hypothetical protein HYALB_00011375 [Hymenoscyphus albidus]
MPRFLKPEKKGSQLCSYPKLSYYAGWSIYILNVFILSWAGFSIRDTTLQPTFQHLDPNQGLAFSDYNWAALRDHLEKVILDRVGIITGLYFVLHQGSLLYGYLLARQGYKAADGKPSGDAKMVWLKDRIREHDTGCRRYNVFTAKLQICHYLVNPKGYHGLVFCYREAIYTILWRTIFTYSYILFFYSVPTDGTILSTIVFYANWSGVIIWLWVTSSFAAANGWYAGTGRCITELRSEFENSEKFLCKRKRMECWIEKFLAEERPDAGEDLESFEKCIEDVFLGVQQ